MEIPGVGGSIVKTLCNGKSWRVGERVLKEKTHGGRYSLEPDNRPHLVKYKVILHNKKSNKV